MRFLGTVTATGGTMPVVLRDGDTTPAAARNTVAGYTPAVNDRVVVEADGLGARMVVGRL